MNRKKRGIRVAATLASGLVILGLSALAGGEEEVTLIGTVVEAEWDDDGYLIAVDLETGDGTFSISDTGKGNELLAVAGQRVEIVGTVSVDDDGWNVLSVSSYTLLPVEEIRSPRSTQ